MIELHITRTGKSYNGSDDYASFDSETLNFETLAEAKSYLKDTYGNSKRQYMFVDDKDGQAKRIGYIYSFNNKDYSHNSETWRQQDWVSFAKVTRSRITI